MSDCTPSTPNRIDPMQHKRLVMIQRIGPAFDPQEVESSHVLLDNAGVPRVDAGGRTWRLSERVAYLCGYAQQLAILADVQR